MVFIALPAFILLLLFAHFRENLLPVARRRKSARKNSRQKNLWKFLDLKHALTRIVIFQFFLFFFFFLMSFPTENRTKTPLPDDSRTFYVQFYIEGLKNFIIFAFIQSVFTFFHFHFPFTFYAFHSLSFFLFLSVFLVHRTAVFDSFSFSSKDFIANPEDPDGSIRSWTRVPSRLNISAFFVL